MLPINCTAFHDLNLKRSIVMIFNKTEEQLLAENNAFFQSIHDMNMELKEKGAGFVRYVSIKNLPQDMSRGYGSAILIGVPLSKQYILGLRQTIPLKTNEFADMEHLADELAEWVAEYLKQRGFQSYAQSGENNWQNGLFNTETKSSVLPHKTIARLAGLGWIGKNNLLVTERYGCAFCMCTVLTNAPIKVDEYPISDSRCGDCNICRDICPTSAIHGYSWTENNDRDKIVDVFSCECCLKCLSHCPWTVRYSEQNE